MRDLADSISPSSFLRSFFLSLSLPLFFSVSLFASFIFLLVFFSFTFRPPDIIRKIFHARSQAAGGKFAPRSACVFLSISTGKGGRRGQRGRRAKIRLSPRRGGGCRARGLIGPPARLPGARVWESARALNAPLILFRRGVFIFRLRHLRSSLV